MIDKFEYIDNTKLIDQDISKRVFDVYYFINDDIWIGDKWIEYLKIWNDEIDNFVKENNIDKSKLIHKFKVYNFVRWIGLSFEVSGFNELKTSKVDVGKRFNIGVGLVGHNTWDGYYHNLETRMFIFKDNGSEKYTKGKFYENNDKDFSKMIKKMYEVD